MEFVVDTNWLAQQLDNPEVVIVDCRFSLADPSQGQQKYQTGHIPGAYYLSLDQDLSSPVSTHGGRHPLPDPNLLGNKLAAMGIEHSHTLVVVYDDSKLAFASRLWWLLRYYGHERVAVLNGGYAAWVSGGYPVHEDRPMNRPGRFEPVVRSNWIVDIEQVQQPDPQWILIDAREADRYAGLREPIDPIAGHIPGAVNYPWLEITDDQGLLHPLEKQQQHWAGLDSKLVKVAYCGSGVTACVNLLSMAIAGVPKTLLYPGSWSDWCSYLPTLPKRA
jgi:thiosulfate/3-mercaptopyruvate sulfurtransferase